jgi:signal recognition particle subunit SRP19
MGIRHVVQPYKGYSRDPDSQWDNLGRVLVDMEQEGPVEFDVDNLPDIDASGNRNKRKLLREISQRIPSLPGRARRLEQQAEKLLEEAKAKEAAAQKSSSQKTSSGAQTTGKSKKKGKKKR